MTQNEYVNPLQQYMQEKVEKYLKEHRGILPTEFKEVPQNHLIRYIAEHAANMLRRVEDDALDAGIEKFACLIRISKKDNKTKH